MTVDPDTTLQQQARALGDPTRHGVFRHVAAAAVPVGVAELTDAFGLNHNAIRQHLAKLVAAGLLIEATAPSAGPGRPRLTYRVDPSADSRWDVTGPYERLSIWLAEMVRTGDPPVEVGRRAGRAALHDEGGAATPPEPQGDGHASKLPSQPASAGRSGDPIGRFASEMARQGFDPEVRRRGDRVELTLRTCPFHATAVADPDTVCGFHLGMAHGLAERIAGLAVDDLVVKDPRRAHCRLRCHVEAVT